MTREEIVAGLKRAVDLAGPSLAKAGYPERVESVQELIDNGEYKLAAEILSSNLYEFDCPIPAEALTLLRELSVQFGLPEDTWRDLEALVVPA